MHSASRVYRYSELDTVPLRKTYPILSHTLPGISLRHTSDIDLRSYNTIQFYYESYNKQNIYSKFRLLMLKTAF